MMLQALFGSVICMTLTQSIFIFKKLKYTTTLSFRLRKIFLYGGPFNYLPIQSSPCRYKWNSRIIYQFNYHHILYKIVIMEVTLLPQRTLRGKIETAGNHMGPYGPKVQNPGNNWAIQSWVWGLSTWPTPAPISKSSLSNSMFQLRHASSYLSKKKKKRSVQSGES